MNMIWVILSNDWQIETAFRAKAVIAGRDKKISDSCRKGYSCPMGEKIGCIEISVFETTRVSCIMSVMIRNNDFTCNYLKE